MRKEEIVKKLNKEMKALNKHLSVVDDGDLTLRFDGSFQACFTCFAIMCFRIVKQDYLKKYLKEGRTLVQFYVQGQQLLEELDE